MSSTHSYAQSSALDLVSADLRTTSLVVAEKFGKRHVDVKRAIDNLEIPNDFRLRNFAQTEFTDRNGDRQGLYALTRDGFTLLVMGFTGKAAMAWKIRFIEAFNAMEARLRAQEAQPALPSPRRYTSSGMADRKRLAQIAHWQGSHDGAVHMLQQLGVSADGPSARMAQLLVARDRPEAIHAPDHSPTLNDSQRRRLRHAVEDRVYSLLPRKSIRSWHFSQLWSALNGAMGVTTYSDIAPEHFDAAMAFVSLFDFEKGDDE